MKHSIYENEKERTIKDACEFLQISRKKFFYLANKWPIFSRKLWREKRLNFYTSWTGIYGISNICANILDQFARNNIWYAINQSIKPNYSLLDFGCGTAALSFIFIKKVKKIVFIDVPNIAQDFLLWRIKKYKIKNTKVCKTFFNIDENFDTILCIDVLEHLPNPSQIFIENLNTILKKEGYLILDAPWFVRCHEHLKMASLDWHLKGYWFLRRHYKLLRRINIIPTSGIYKKKF